VTEERPVFHPRVLVAIAAVVVILAALHSATVLVIPVLIAALLAVVIAPLQQRLIDRGMHRFVAFGLVAAATVVALVAVVAILEVEITAFIADLPSYAPGIEQMLTNVLQAGTAVGLHLTRLVNTTDVVRSALSAADALTQSLLSSLAEWVIVLLLVVFMLFEALDLPKKIKNILGEGGATRRLADFAATLSRFTRLTTVDASFTAVGDFVILLIMGVPSALLWAGLAFVFSYVPDVGFLMTVIPPTLATFVLYGTARALVVFIVMTVVDSFVGIVLLPKLIGERLGVAPFWGLLSLVFWSWLLGLAGTILAIPLTITVKFLLESSSATAPLGSLIAPLRERPRIGSRWHQR
jgi:predicted PurR-regulated permease PerM